MHIPGLETVPQLWLPALHHTVVLYGRLAIFYAFDAVLVASMCMAGHYQDSHRDLFS